MKERCVADVARRYVAITREREVGSAWAKYIKQDARVCRPREVISQLHTDRRNTSVLLREPGLCKQRPEREMPHPTFTDVIISSDCPFHTMRPACSDGVSSTSEASGSLYLSTRSWWPTTRSRDLSKAPRDCHHAGQDKAARRFLVSRTDKTVAKARSGQTGRHRGGRIRDMCG